MKRHRIVLVGGGSNAWTPNIVKDLLLTEGISNSDFVLFDINRKASDLNAAFLTKLNGQLKTGAHFISTDDRRKALKGADYVIITISTGGLKAMAHDLAIPERYGIYHTVGDTAGPGGWARFIRNFGVFVSLADDIKRLAPD
jgi:alpha-galactosidase/6-phospho-beta-glucosidase family protein